MNYLSVKETESYESLPALSTDENPVSHLII